MEKTYQALTMVEAYEMIKRDLGADAVIIDSRTVRKGGLLGFGGRQLIEVTASSDTSKARRRISRRPRSNNSNNSSSREPVSGSGRKLLQEMYNNGSLAGSKVEGHVASAVGVAETTATTRSGHGNAAPKSNGSNGSSHPLEALLDKHASSLNGNTRTETRRTEKQNTTVNTPRGLEALLGGNEPSTAPKNHPGSETSARDRFQESSSDDGGVTAAITTQQSNIISRDHANGMSTGNETRKSLQSDATGSRVKDVSVPHADHELSRELLEIRAMMRTLMKRQNDSPMSDLPEHLFCEYLTLLEQEVSEELAEQIVHSVRDHLTDEEVHNEMCVRREMRRVIESFIPSNDIEPNIRRVEGRPYVYTLIGPTGVGKTTTLAKLAAKFKLQHDMSVALITIDTYRIAAVDQLRTYAQIIGLPVHVVLTPDEMRQAIRKCAHHDMVLIDTAGRSQRDTDKLTELSAFVEAARPDHVSLVLSSTCSQRVMMDAVDRFGQVRSDSVIFTKMDEAVNFGVVFNTLRKVRKKLSYVTTGQEVPNDIQVADGTRIAEWVMRGRQS